jgi:hypothetical protein
MATTHGGNQRRRGSALFALMLLCLFAVLNGGCLRLFARSAPEMPPLEVPMPPPRAVETADAEPPPPGTLVEVPASSLPPAAATARPRPPAPARPDTAKVEPPKPEPAPVAADLPVAEAPRAAAGTTLQTAPPEREAELEKTINELLGRASGTLNRVDYRRLNADARLQYDQAKRFAEQAAEAVRAKNLLYAYNLADKAATLAAQLAGR